MKQLNTIIVAKALLFLLGITLPTCALAAPVPQKKSTPDPYFNPKNQTAPATTSPTQAQPTNAVAKPAAPVVMAGWEPPATPIQPNFNRESSPSVHASNNQLSNDKTLLNENSIIRQQPLTPSAAPATQSFTAPVANLSLDNSNSFAPAKTAGPATIPSAPPLDPANDFTADLSNLKRGATSNSTSSTFSPGPSPNQNPNPPPLAPTSKPTSTPPLTPNLPDPTHPTPTRSAQAKTESAEQLGKAFEPTQLLAIVGGEPVFVGDLLFEVNQRIEKMMPDAPPEIKSKLASQGVYQLLPQFVNNKILYVGTLKQLPKDADVNKVLEQAGKQFDEDAMPKMIDAAGLKSPAEFDAQLRALGSSLRKMRLSWSQDQLTRYFLSQQLDVEKEITHRAMLEEYHKHLPDYKKPAKARWEQVMVRFDRTTSREEAKRQLMALGDEIVYGANFAAVAKKSSHGFSAAQGGRHDWTTKGALVLKEIDAAIFTLPLNELSDIIETADGFHIVRVLERTEATHTPFLEAQVEIKSRLMDEKREIAFEDHLKKLKQEIPVEYFNTDSPAARMARLPK